MLIASTLCRDDITKVIKQVRATRPQRATSDDSSLAATGVRPASAFSQWKTNVADPALALVVSMEQLSRGWSSGLLGLGAGLGVYGLGWFTLAINSQFCSGVDTIQPWAGGNTQGILLVISAFCPFLALLLASDLATTSSRCDLLMRELNTCGLRHGPEYHLMVEWLEVRLQRLVRFIQTPGCMSCFPAYLFPRLSRRVCCDGLSEPRTRLRICTKSHSYQS